MAQLAIQKVPTEQLSINQFVCIFDKILYVNLDMLSKRYNKKISLQSDVIPVGELLFIKKDDLNFHFDEKDMKLIERDINASIFDSLLDAEERRKAEAHNLQIISNQQQTIEKYKNSFIKKNFDMEELKRKVDGYDEDIQRLKEDLATHANYLDYHLDSLRVRDEEIKLANEKCRIQETFISGIYTLKIAENQVCL